MKRFRVLMMLAAVLALTGSVHAQSESGATRSTPRDLSELEAAARGLAESGQECCEGQVWYLRALEHGVTAMQRFRSMCATQSASVRGCGEAACVKPGTVKAAHCNEVRSCPFGVVSGSAGTCTQFSKCGTGSFMLGVGVNSCQGITGSAGSFTPSCGVKDVVPMACPMQFRVVQATTPCNCAKACACCEHCKAAKKVTVQAHTPPRPVAAPPVHWVPAPTPATVMSMPMMPPVKHARLVTPDFEAHCERMTQRGDMIILEGNVMLLSKKHAQPMRVEACRVVVNMRDGSFTVESDVRPVQRMPTGHEQVYRIEMVTPATMPEAGHRPVIIVPVHPRPTPSSLAPREERLYIGEVPPIPGR